MYTESVLSSFEQSTVIILSYTLPLMFNYIEPTAKCIYFVFPQENCEQLNG
jgi:hypothetical protein